MKVVNFLDVTLDLNSGKHKPYNKPTNIPYYVSAQSNHPKSILKNIPLSVNRRLNILSSDEEAFNENKYIWQKGLNDAGYNHELKFEKVNLDELNKSKKKKDKKQNKSKREEKGC